VSLAGDLGFRKAGEELVVVGNAVTARMEAGPVLVELANADFGLIAGSEEFAFELKNGVFNASITGLAGISAESVFVQYTNATTTIAAGRKVSAGEVEYAFTQGIAANTIAFAVRGVAADVAGFVSVGGDLGFRQVGAEILAVGNNVTARLEAGPVFVELAGADFGLVAGETDFAFELKNGTFNAAIGSLAGISAQTVFVQYSNDSTTVNAGHEIEVGGIVYTFADGIDAGTVVFSVTGFSADVLGFVSLSGDLGFRLQGSEILAAGNNVSARMGVGEIVYVELANADFG